MVSPVREGFSLSFLPTEPSFPVMPAGASLPPAVPCGAWAARLGVPLSSLVSSHHGSARLFLGPNWTVLLPWLCSQPDRPIGQCF